MSGLLADRFGARPFATGGLAIVSLSFVALLLLPVDFNYWAFAALIFLNSIGMGMFIAPNQAGIMNSLPANQRGAGAGMAGTFNASAQVLSIGIFFTLMILGLAATLPSALYHGLIAQGVNSATALRVSHLPPVGSLFASFLGYNPMQTLLGHATLAQLPPATAHYLTSRSFFPHLISSPFGSGLTEAFAFAAGACRARCGGFVVARGQVPLRRPRERCTRSGQPRQRSRPKKRCRKPNRCWANDMTTRTAKEGAQSATALDGGIRISDAAASAGVSARTLRYYEELGLLAPSLYTSGGERRYTRDDLTQLERILELREVLGMNLEEIKEFLSFETRLDQLRTAYRASQGATTKAARAEQRATFREALELNESLAAQLNAKLARMDAFRAKLSGDARKCRELLKALD